MPTTFILNDENAVNTQGFRVANAGLNLSEFKQNPVMLFNHNRDKVIGSWENIRLEDNKLLADPIFDVDDAEAMSVQKKVEKGLIKGCSIGYRIDKKNITLEEDSKGQKILVIPGTLTEASITPIPSNKSAVKLYESVAMTELSEKDILQLYENFSKKNIQDMQDIVQLQEENKTLQQKIAGLENELKCSQKQAVSDLIRQGYTDKKLTKEFAEKLEKQITDGQVSLEAAKEIVETLPAFESVVDKIDKASEKDSKFLSEIQDKNFAELMQTGKAEHLKKIDIDLFKLKYKEQFGKEYSQN